MPGRITNGCEELRLPHVLAHSGVWMTFGNGIEEEILTNNAHLTPFRRGGSVMQKLGEDSTGRSTYLDGLFFGEGCTVLVLHKWDFVVSAAAIVDNDQCIQSSGVVVVLPSPEGDIWIVDLSVRQALCKSGKGDGRYRSWLESTQAESPPIVQKPA